MGPEKLAIIHCSGHQKRKDPVSEGNSRADEAAQHAAAALEIRPRLPLTSLDLGDSIFPDHPKNSEDE